VCSKGYSAYSLGCAAYSRECVAYAKAYVAYARAYVTYGRAYAADAVPSVRLLLLLLPPRLHLLRQLLEP
jgi:hypothetical protein